MHPSSRKNSSLPRFKLVIASSLIVNGGGSG